MWLNEKLIECPIGAYEDGIVVVAHPCDDNPRGVHITIDHGNGLITKYFHIEINKLYVKVGDYVKKGNPIGYMGTTGASTGEHLHFQVELNGIPVNPIPYLV